MSGAFQKEVFQDNFQYTAEEAAIKILGKRSFILKDDSSRERNISQQSRDDNFSSSRRANIQSVKR